VNDIRPAPAIQSQPLTIQGPAGPLQAVLDAVTGPEATHPVTRVAIVCHPHPLYGGTLQNKVVYTLARTFNSLGMPAVRFNYRGVGASAGSYDDGIGEVEDALAVCRWAQSQWPQAALWLGGFSFGGTVALQTAQRIHPQRLVTVAPAVARSPMPDFQVPDCPWLIVQGDRDEIVAAAMVKTWVESLSAKLEGHRPARWRPTLVTIDGAEHFFHGRLNELREAILTWVHDQPE